ncbi:MAG: hypothetical protein ACMZI0_00540 [Symbiopectobacterium sp.]|uniref:hypothetical protein n=1 Tax=Symbiopectobacterium sp. TaxID=2952789 RepID=UPI0039EC037A
MNIASINDTNNCYLQNDNRIRVEMGNVGCATDRSSVLHTDSLTYCCALAVLSKWNGRWYQQRTLTLLHIIGGNLFFGIKSKSDRQPNHANRWLSKLKSELIDGGKVIFAGGIDCSSDMALSMSIHQTDADGQKPLQELLTTPGTEIMLAVALGITIYPNGAVVLDSTGARGELSYQECLSILQDQV